MKAWLLAAGIALAAVGCGDNGGVYAVTLTEPTTIRCTGKSELGGIEDKPLEKQLHDIERAWANAAEVEPPAPQGWELRVSETAEAMQAWFGEQPANEVYVGSPHDDYVEGTYVDRFRFATEKDEKKVPYPCGERVRTEATLSVTVDHGEVEGRIRRTEHSYLASIFSQCDAHIECVRNIAVIGEAE